MSTRKPAPLQEETEQPAPTGMDAATAEITPEAPKILVRFSGGDTHFIQGIPARDLTAEDWAELTSEMQEKALALKLYEMVETPKDGE